MKFESASVCHSGKLHNLLPILATLLLTVPCALNARAGGKYAMLPGRVEKVFDGDTIAVRLENGKLETVRFWGIDAPESYIKRYGYTEFMGNEAKRFTQHILTGNEVLLKTVHRGDDFLRDRYRRILAFVYCGKDDISALLLGHGLAKVYRKSKCPRQAEFYKLEKEALLRRAGIWNKEAEKEYYRRQYTSNKNRFLILWFWEHDKQFLQKLLQETPLH